MSKRFSQVTTTTPKAKALLKALRALRAAQGRHDSPTQAMRLTYREAFRVLREANPATSYAAIRSHIRGEVKG